MATKSRPQTGDAGAGAGANNRSGSTTWAWKQVKIRTPAGGQRASAPKAHRWYSLPTFDRRRRLTISVRYRGGPECWWEVRARGAAGNFTGSTALHDVLREVMQLP